MQWQNDEFDMNVLTIRLYDFYDANLMIGIWYEWTLRPEWYNTLKYEINEWPHDTMKEWHADWKLRYEDTIYQWWTRYDIWRKIRIQWNEIDMNNYDDDLNDLWTDSWKWYDTNHDAGYLNDNDMNKMLGTIYEGYMIWMMMVMIRTNWWWWLNNKHMIGTKQVKMIWTN